MTNKQENYVRALREMRRVMIENDNWENLTRFIEAVTAGGMAIQRLDEIREQPKTGHWIGDKAYPICPKCNCNIIEEYISCSDYVEMYKPMKYCPNCGAKMIEPQESEEV